MTIESKQLPFQGMSDHDAFELEPQFAANVRNVRSFRERIVRSPGGTQLCPTPAPDGMTNPGTGVAFGTFVKSTSTGTQTVSHTLGTTPVAIMLFSEGGTSLGSVANGITSARGWSDGTTSRCQATVSNVGTPGTVVGASWKQLRTNLVAFLSGADGSTVAVANWSAWNSTTFTINWTSNDSQAREIHFMVIGGGTATAKVMTITQSFGTGNQSFTGVGFQPDVILTMAFQAEDLNAVHGNGNQNLGCADSFGHQWNAAANTGAGIGISTDFSIFDTTVCWAGISQGNDSDYSQAASFVSMDADGFTVNRTRTSNDLVNVLCLGGLSGYRVGTFTRTISSAPIRQSVTGVGFQPQGVIFAGTGPSDGQEGTASFGGTDGINSTYMNWFRQHTGTTKSIMRTDAVYGDLSHPTTNGVENVRASIASLDADGFTLNYTLTNSRAAEAGYIAMASVGTSQAGEVGIPRNYPEVYVDPSGPAVQRYVMLTHKSAFYYTAVTPSTGVFTATSERYTGNQYQRFSIANTQGIAAWSQGVDNIREWDGTSFTALITSGTDHAARALLAFADRIVSVRPYFGGADHPTQIRWCVNGDVNDWSGTGSGALEIIETSQDPLITGFVLGDRAFLCKRREIIELIWTGTDSPVFGTQPRIRGMGVLAPHSVGLAEQLAFFLGPDDVYMFDGSTLTAIGERMYNTFTSLIDYQNLDVVQGAVYTPDSQYHLVIPPYKFIYDYRRDIWDWDDVYDFQAIGVYNVGDGTNFTADIDKSEFIVVGDSLAQTTRVDFQATSWLGAPIDSYFETKDYTADDIGKNAGVLGRFSVSLWDMNSLREIRFQGPPGNVVEVGISLDRGVTYETTMVTINQFGVGVAWFQRSFSMIRFRFRDYGTDDYEIRGSWGFDVEQSGYNLP